MGDQQTKLTLKAPITTKVVCFSRLPKCLRSLCDKQRGSRSDCSYMNSLIWVHPVCFYTKFVSNVRQLFAADDFSRRHFSDAFFLALRYTRLQLMFFVVCWSQLSLVVKYYEKMFCYQIFSLSSTCLSGDECGKTKIYMSRNMRFPTMWHFD